MATAEGWLEEHLLGMRDLLPFLDADMVGGLVSYCPHASDEGVGEYLKNLIGDSQRAKDIVAGYLQRRAAQRANQSAAISGGQAENFNGMQTYMKPKAEDDRSRGSKKAPKQKEKFSAPPAAQQRGGSLPLNGSNGRGVGEGAVGGVGERGVGGVGEKGVGEREVGVGAGGGRKGRKGKGVGLADIEKGRVIFSRTGVCECAAARHRLVNNCLACGRVVCEQEGEGPCSFCGTLVLKEGSEYAGLEAEGEGVGEGVSLTDGGSTKQWPIRLVS